MPSNFYYDPARRGYDAAIWKTVTGTPVAESFELFPSRYDALTASDVVTGVYADAGDNSLADAGSVAESVTVAVT